MVVFSGGVIRCALRICVMLLQTSSSSSSSPSLSDQIDLSLSLLLFCSHHPHFSCEFVLLLFIPKFLVCWYWFCTKTDTFPFFFLFSLNLLKCLASKLVL